MSPPTARQEVEAWLSEQEENCKREPIYAPMWQDRMRLARGWLATIDAEHHDHETPVDYCACGRIWPCPRKAEHERKLLEVLRGA